MESFEAIEKSPRPLRWKSLSGRRTGSLAPLFNLLSGRSHKAHMVGLSAARRNCCGSACCFRYWVLHSSLLTSICALRLSPRLRVMVARRLSTWFIGWAGDMSTLSQGIMPPIPSTLSDSFSLRLTLSVLATFRARWRARPSSLLRCFLTSASSQSGLEGDDVETEVG